MGVLEDMIKHAGHHLECVSYRNESVSLECIDCGVTVATFDKDDRRKKEIIGYQVEVKNDDGQTTYPFTLGNTVGLPYIPSFVIWPLDEAKHISEFLEMKGYEPVVREYVEGDIEEPTQGGLKEFFLVMED